MLVCITDDPDRPVSTEDPDDFGRSPVEVVGLGSARLRAGIHEEKHR
ncbi:hypothetical protein ABT404_14890 [Streptomyces hyaluromycini]|uniref:Uncharacterized protein n=1 Tax=Streptomyces hyaluromycini TaxID=1377993 RepID=A0ABV1WVH0_9ACTN